MRTVEKTRTKVGDDLFQQGISIAEIVRRVRVRVLRTWANGEFGEIAVSLDGGPWVNEGPYLLTEP